MKDKELKPFANHFQHTYAVTMVPVFMELVNYWRSGAYMPPKILSLVINFLEAW